MFICPLQSYPDFCRAMFDTASQPVMEAVLEMERRFGKVSSSSGGSAAAAVEAFRGAHAAADGPCLWR